MVRPLEATDFAVWYAGYDQRQPAQSAFDEGLLDMTICTEEWFADLVARHQSLREADEQYVFAIFTLAGEHVGMLNLATLARANMDWADVGYSIHNQHWRQGYAYEALSGFLEFAKNQLNFHRLEAHVDPENLPSQRLLEKLGFGYEVTRKNFHYEDDQWKDQMVYTKNLD